MHWSKWTLIVLIVFVALLLVWEAFVLTNKERGDTISEVMQAMVFRYPIIAFTLGIVLGHFLWPLYPRAPDATPTVIDAPKEAGK